MKIKLFRKEFCSPVQWGIGENGVNGYVDMTMNIELRRGISFTVNVANKSFCYRNPFKAIMLALESESVGTAKYNALKELLRDKDMFRAL